MLTEEITLEQVEEFYRFLQGKLPAEMIMACRPKLSERKAFKIIWYLQEHLRIIPDKFERCSCGVLFDMGREGHLKQGKMYCDRC